MSSRHSPDPNLCPRSLVLAFACLLGACNGGSSADITGTGDRPDSEQGEVQGYGSIIVNGTHYETGNDTQILIDGESGAASDLALGMQVEVEVDAGQLRRNGAQARRIRFNAMIEGPIDSIDLERQVLVVMGMDVQIDLLSRLLDQDRQVLNLTDLAVDDIVQVSGYPRAAGGVFATYLRRQPPRQDPFFLRGRVESLQAGSKRFFINDLEVDYGSAGLIDPDTPENGDLVEVQGRPDSAAPRFKAERVSELRDADAVPARRGGVQGVIRSIDTNSQCPELRFVINQRPARVDANTVYHNGGCEDLQADRRVQAIGSFDANGTLQVEQLAIAPELTAIVMAQIESISPAGSPGTAEDALCTLRVWGNLFIDIGPETRQGYTDGRQNNRGYSCESATTGETIMVIGNYQAMPPNDRIAAALLAPGPEFQSSSQFENLAVAAGQIETISAGSRRFRLLGTLVQVSNQTDFGESGEAEFFAQTQPGDFVSAIGNWNGSVIQAMAVRRKFSRDFE